MVSNTISYFSRRAASVFPNTTRAKYERFLNITNAYLTTSKQTCQTNKKELSHLLSKSALKPRDTKWILDNRVCLEKIKPGNSTINGAGRGAFAQVTIEKGEIVAPAPLLNITNKDLLLTYDSCRKLGAAGGT